MEPKSCVWSEVGRIGHQIRVLRGIGLYMETEEASSSSAATAAAAAGGEQSRGVANANLRRAREQEQEGAPARNGVANANLRLAREQEQEAPARGEQAPVQQQRQMPDWMSFLPDATRANAMIWPALEDETAAE